MHKYHVARARGQLDDPQVNAVNSVPGSHESVNAIAMLFVVHEIAQPWVRSGQRLACLGETLQFLLRPVRDETLDELVRALDRDRRAAALSSSIALDSSARKACVSLTKPSSKKTDD